MAKAFGVEQETGTPALLGKVGRPSVGIPTRSTSVGSAFQSLGRDLSTLAADLNKKARDKKAGIFIAEANESIDSARARGDNPVEVTRLIQKKKGKFAKEFGMQFLTQAGSQIGLNRQTTQQVIGDKLVTLDANKQIISSRPLDESTTGSEIVRSSTPEDEARRELEDQSVRVAATSERFANESSAILKTFAETGGELHLPDVHRIVSGVNELSRIANDTSINAGIQKLGVTDPDVMTQLQSRSAETILSQIDQTVSTFASGTIADALSNQTLGASEVVRLMIALKADFLEDAQNSGLYSATGMTAKSIGDAFDDAIQDVNQWATAAQTNDLKKMENVKKAVTLKTDLRVARERERVLGDVNNQFLLFTAAMEREIDGAVKITELLKTLPVLVKDAMGTAVHAPVKNLYDLIRTNLSFKAEIKDLSTVKPTTLTTDAQVQGHLNRVLRTYTDPNSALLPSAYDPIIKQLDALAKQHPDRGIEEAINKIKARQLVIKNHLKEQDVSEEEAQRTIRTITDDMGRPRRTRRIRNKQEDINFGP